MFHLFRLPIVRGLLALAVLLLLVENFLPSSLGEENGPIEIVQVAVLFIGAFICMGKARTSEGRTRCLWYAGILFFLLLAGRELSWGRVFMEPIRPGIYPPVKDLPYGPLVHPMIGVTMVAIIALIIRGKIVRYLRTHSIPVTALILAVITAFLAVDDEHLNLIPWETDMVIEEFCELLAYALLAYIMSKLKSS